MYSAEDLQTEELVDFQEDGQSATLVHYTLGFYARFYDGELENLTGCMTSQCDVITILLHKKTILLRQQRLTAGRNDM